MLRWFGLILLSVLVLAGWGYANAVRDPVMRSGRFGMAEWPAATAPLRVALISDMHLQGPDMPPESAC